MTEKQRKRINQLREDHAGHDMYCDEYFLISIINEQERLIKNLREQLAAKDRALTEAWNLAVHPIELNKRMASISHAGWEALKRLAAEEKP